MKQIVDVINLHFIDHCNYRCCYCFVKKEGKLLSLNNIKKVVDNISNYFKENNIKGRINLVGGETFLCSYLQEIIDYIAAAGISVSIVTNGSLLTKNFIDKNTNKLSTIGISVDSLKHGTNLLIGRSQGGKTISRGDLVDICKYIKAKGIRLKINHCVSRLNQNEDISSFIKEISPDRFKIFQMTVVDSINGFCRALQVTKEEFDICCNKYLGLNPVIEYETDMKSSYVMINSSAELFIDKDEAPLGNLLTDSLDKLLDNNKLNIEAYNRRYIPLQS